MEKEQKQTEPQSQAAISKQALASLSKFLSRCTLSPNEIDEFISLLNEVNKLSAIAK